MKLISSKQTWFYKKIIPVILVLALVGSFMPILVAQGRPNAPPLLVFFFPLFAICIAGFAMRRLTADLADEVEDCGTYLMVRINGQEEQIFLSNIMNVSYAGAMNPARVTLTLRQPGRFGKEVVFSPVVRRFDFLRNFRLRNAIVDDLIERVDSARGKG